MNERLKILRKELHLTLKKFAEQINLAESTLSKIEHGYGVLTDRTISDICREFNVNETWLRTGEGNMFIELSRDEELSRYLGELLKDEDENFKKRLISALVKVPADDTFWDTLNDIISDLTNKG